MTQADNPEVERAEEQPRTEAEAAETEAAPEEYTPAQTRRAMPQSFVLKLLLVTVGVVVVLVALAFIIFNNMRSARNAPIEFEIFPGAQLTNKSEGPGADLQFFSTTASIAEVYDFYAQRIGSLQYRTVGSELGEDRDRGCRKIYDSEQPSEEPGRYYARCIIDNSQTDVTQRLLMTISYNQAEALTVIRVERAWGS